MKSVLLIAIGVIALHIAAGDPGVLYREKENDSEIQ